MEMSPRQQDGHQPPSPYQKLFKAIQNGDAFAVKESLDQGANPIQPNEEHQTPLYEAFVKGSYQIVKILLDHDGFGVNLVEEANSTHATMLHMACKRPVWLYVVQKLLEKGASVDVRDKSSRLPIHYASETGAVETVIALLAAGSSPDARDAEGKTPLHMAAAYREPWRIPEIPGYVGSVMIDKLIEAGAQPNAKDAKGWTPIFCASKSRNVQAVKALARAGALITVQDEDGMTPLHIACEYNREESTGAFAAQELVEKGADVNATAHNGMKPLHVALIHDNSSAVWILLNQGANPDFIPVSQCKTLEPSWDRLLRREQLGYHTAHKDPALSTPASDSEQKQVCEGLRCYLWPWNPVPFVVARPTVHELLYSGPVSSELPKALALSNAPWVHLPGNCVRSIQTVQVRKQSLLTDQVL